MNTKVIDNTAKINAETATELNNNSENSSDNTITVIDDSTTNLDDKTVTADEAELKKIYNSFKSSSNEQTNLSVDNKNDDNEISTVTELVEIETEIVETNIPNTNKTIGNTNQEINEIYNSVQVEQSSDESTSSTEQISTDDIEPTLENSTDDNIVESSDVNNGTDEVNVSLQSNNIQNIESENSNNSEANSETVSETETPIDLSLMTNEERQVAKYPISKLLKKVPTINKIGYRALEKDIIKNGLRVKILVYKGAIINGRARLKICLDNNIEPEYEIIDYEIKDLKKFIESLHVHHKDLTATQRAILASDNLKDFEDEESLANDDAKQNDNYYQETHDSARLCTNYYCVSYGYLALVQKLKKMKGHETALKLAREGKINIYQAIELVGKADLEKVVNHLDNLQMDTALTIKILSIKDNDPDLYKNILLRTKDVDVEKDLKVFTYKNYQEIYIPLKSGTIDFAQANRKVEVIKKSINNTKPQSTVEKVDFEITDTTKRKLIDAAKATNLELDSFIEMLLETYKKSIEANNE